MNTLKQELPVSEKMNDKKKIVHLIQALDSGGCENMLLRTIPLLTNFDHLIITLKKKGDLGNEFERNNIRIINIGQKGFFDIPSYARLIRSVKDFKPDFIITYLFHADIIGRMIVQRFVKIPLISFLRTNYNHSKYLIARIAEKMTARFAKRYFANSESVKNFYAERIGINREKIAVVPNGIDTAFYEEIPKNWGLRKGFGINNNDFAIICVSNLHINKGHAYLLKAFEDAYAKHGNIKLLLVGDGEERERLKKQIEKYQSRNNILFLGKRTDVPELLKISDIFIMPTLFEGMSNALMEAMASELPIITTDIPENRCLISDSENGLLVPTKNAPAIKSAIIRLIENENLKKTIAFSAKRFIKENFDMDIIIKKWNRALIN